MLNDPRVHLPEFADRLFAVSDPALVGELQAQLQDVRGRSGLQQFLSEYLEAAVGPSEAMVVCLGVRLGETRSLEGALALDAELDAMAWSPRRREASRRMGRVALQLAVAVIDSPMLLAFSIRAEAGTTPCHHALTFGVIAGRLGWPARAAAEAFLQATASAVLMAARPRLGLSIADEEDVLWAAGGEIARLARKAAAAESGSVWSFTPMVTVPAAV